MNFSPVVNNDSQSPGFSDGSRIRSGSGRSVFGNVEHLLVSELPQDVFLRWSGAG